ncbi:MAG TPA: hypothetical protein VMT95_01175 [Candidatus Binatia bacterium]|nr:hypothetical protein [Candidatus Binatia bacterium]
MPLVDMGFVSAFARDQGFSDEDLRGTLAELVRRRFIKQPPARGGLLPVSIEPTLPGLTRYVDGFEHRPYQTARRETINAILDDKAHNLDELIAVCVDHAPGLLELVIDRLGEEGHLDVVHSFGGLKKWTARPSLRRE